MPQMIEQDELEEVCPTIYEVVENELITLYNKHQYTSFKAFMEGIDKLYNEESFTDRNELDELFEGQDAIYILHCSFDIVKYICNDYFNEGKGVYRPHNIYCSVNMFACFCALEIVDKIAHDKGICGCESCETPIREI